LNPQVALQRWGLASCVALALADPCAAQDVVTLSVAQALACMTPPESERGVPEYDAALVKRKDGGAVQVELSFFGPTSEPEVRFIGPQTLSGLEEAVLAHVRMLRVPCLPPGTTVTRIQMTYDFVPNDGRKVVASKPKEAADPARQQTARCLARITGPEVPDYPMSSLDRGDQGKFLVRMVFSGPSAPPVVAILGGPRDARLRASIERWLEGYRLPCLTGEPVAVRVLFDFRIDGGERTVINDLTLQQLLGSVEKVPTPVYFDTTTMTCPFDVRVQHQQPYAENFVGQLGAANPARQPFLDWLAAMQLRLKEPHRVLGESFTVSVPCIIIDL
jgi:hypothetical protein